MLKRWIHRQLTLLRRPALVALIRSIATTNVFDRRNVTTRQVAGASGLHVHAMATRLTPGRTNPI